MEIIYRAFDGKEFSNEIDCRAHEDELKASEFASNIHLWDEDKDSRELTAELIEDFNLIMYFRCDTEEAYKFILDLNVKEGYAKGLPSHNGANITWWWNEQKVQWEHLKDKVATIQEELDLLNSMCYRGDEDE